MHIKKEKAMLLHAAVNNFQFFIVKEKNLKSLKIDDIPMSK